MAERDQLRPSADRPPCRQPGCRRPRGQFTLYCDDHHREQLIRVGLERAGLPDPCAAFVTACQQLVRAGATGGIEPDEVTAQLFELFIHGGQSGLERCWSAGLDTLPADVVAGFLARVEANPEPRLFAPLPPAGAVRRQAERTALAMQERLRQRLTEWVPPGQRMVDVVVPAISGGWLVWFVRWLVPDGSIVRVDEPICELESGGVFGNFPDSNLDVLAPAPGVLERVTVADGASVQWGQVLGRIRPARIDP